MDYYAFINPVSKFLCFARIRSDAQKNKGPAFYVRLTDGTYVGSWYGWLTSPLTKHRQWNLINDETMQETSIFRLSSAIK